MIAFYPAQVEEAAFCAALIRETEGALADALFGLDDPQRALRALEYFFHRPGTLYSRDIVEVAHGEGGAVGILVGYTPEQEQQRVRGMLLPILTFYGLWGALRFIRRGMAGFNLHDGDPGDWVIANVAVSAAARGQGVGRQIMLHAEERARQAGCQRTTLLVRLGNPARRLYDALGYLPLAEYRSKKLEQVLKMPGFTWMGKKLT